MVLKRIKGVLAIPPQSSRAAPGVAGSRELAGDQLEAFRKSGWRFVATDEFDTAEGKAGADGFQELAPEHGSSAAAHAGDLPARPRRVYRNPDGRVVIEGASMVVKFQPDTKWDQVVTLLEAHGLEIRSELGFVRNGYRVGPRDADSDADLLEAAERLQAEEPVEYAEPSRVESFESR